MRFLLMVTIATMFAAPLMAQKGSTMAGIYSREQALRGQDVYLGNCKSCHVPESHASPAFRATWNGRPLAELYIYLHERMPKNDPGTLSKQEYADVLAYILRLNRIPDGDQELAPDEKTMLGIRFETTMSVRKDP